MNPDPIQPPLMQQRRHGRLRLSEPVAIRSEGVAQPDQDLVGGDVVDVDVARIDAGDAGREVGALESQIAVAGA